MPGQWLKDKGMQTLKSRVFRGHIRLVVDQEALGGGGGVSCGSRQEVHYLLQAIPKQNNEGNRMEGHGYV